MDGCHGHAKRQSHSVDWAHACFQQQMLMMGRLAWTKSQGIGTANFLHKFLMRRGHKLPHGPLALHQMMVQKSRIWNNAHHPKRCAALSPHSTFRALSGKPAEETRRDSPSLFNYLSPFSFHICKMTRTFHCADSSTVCGRWDTFEANCKKPKCGKARVLSCFQAKVKRLSRVGTVCRRIRSTVD